MENIYKSQKELYREVHMVPLFSALDSSYDKTIEQHFSPCERSCVCHCVCRHGKSASLDFNSGKVLEKEIAELFEESLAA